MSAQGCVAYTPAEIHEYLERFGVAMSLCRRAAGGATEELDAELDAVTAQLSDVELETIGRYLELTG